MRATHVTILALAALLLSASCRSTSRAYRFTPSPLEVLVQESSGAPLLARVLVGIPGAEREGRRSDGMPLLLVRVRIENKSDAPLAFDPSRAVLVGSDLAEFGPARPTPQGVQSVEPGTSTSFLLRFPFPQDGSLEAPLLTGVNLQFELDHPAGAVEMSVTLERNEPEVIVEQIPNFTFGGGLYYGW